MGPRHGIYVMISIVVLLYLSPSVVLAARGQEESLRGLKGFTVEVEILTDILRDGLTEKQIRSEVVSQIQKEGIKVYSQKELSSITGQPTLFIRINGTKIQDNWKFYTYSITVHLFQEAYLARETEGGTFRVSTWFRAHTGHGYLDDIRVQAKEIISIFINTYLSVNPM